MLLHFLITTYRHSPLGMGDTKAALFVLVLSVAQYCTVYWNLLLCFDISKILALLAGCALGTNTFTHIFQVCLTFLAYKPYSSQCLEAECHRVGTPESH